MDAIDVAQIVLLKILQQHMNEAFGKDTSNVSNPGTLTSHRTHRQPDTDTVHHRREQKPEPSPPHLQKYLKIIPFCPGTNSIQSAFIIPNHHLSLFLSFLLPSCLCISSLIPWGILGGDGRSGCNCSISYLRAHYHWDIPEPSDPASHTNSNN